MSKKPVVLIIDNSIGVTGALKSITRTTYDLKDSFDFQFIIPRNSEGRSWIEAKSFFRIHELPMLEIRRQISSIALYIPYLLLNAWRLKRIIKENGVSILHVNDLYNLLPVVVRVLGCRVPYICHIRFLPDRFPKWLFNFWLKLHVKNADKIIAVSQSVMRMLPSHINVEVIPNELPVEERYPEKLPTKENSKKTFLYLSNYMQGKGQNFALEAFSMIHGALPDWKLKFVGSDMGLKKNESFRESLKMRAVELGLEKKVEWWGFTEEVEKEYKEADIVLNFSESESFSITCLEALFFGRPLIATACGGPEEIIDHQETGILVRNKNVEAMAAAMKELALDERLRVELGQNGKTVVRHKYSIEKTTYRLKEIYEIVLKNVK
jgi:glycosyltransferase involved in cell wall biosynthesis